MTHGGPFQRAAIPPGEMQLTRRALLAKPPEFWREWFGVEPAAAEKERIIAGIVRSAVGDEVWLNDTYQVILRRAAEGGMIHLSIKRRDRRAIHDWRDLQEIKNELVGPEHEAVELFPAESRLVDSANQYHLWVIPTLDRFPFGFDCHRHVTGEPVGKSVNRPRILTGPIA